MTAGGAASAAVLGLAAGLALVPPPTGMQAPTEPSCTPPCAHGHGPAARDTPALPGFTAAGSARQREVEAAFLAVPSSAGAAATAHWMTALPHMAGTENQAALADSLSGWLRGLGFDVEVDRYDAYLPHPDTFALELVAPDRRAFVLLEGDPSDLHSWTWNAFSANGTARGPVVYANYGREADFEALHRLGVDAEGAVVLIRYGGVYRGTKVREAERRGAAGVVLYPDPANGGSAAGDTLPDGPYRPDAAVQRGTVSYMWRYTGDPLTPGRPARPGVPRLDPDDARTIPGIPVLNISAHQARQILDALGGPDGPRSFRGGLPVAYRTGPGPAELRMTVRLDYRQRPVRNVIARIPGSGGEAASHGGGSRQAVILGVHFDAWVHGGVDAQSGAGVILEIARGLAALRDTGWAPRRDIILAFWGGEEFGVVGSTEFVEDRLEWLRENAVAYFNIDVFTAGAIDVSGSPSLRDLVWSAARDVPDPLDGRSLADHWSERRGPEDTDRRTTQGDDAGPAAHRPRLGALGLGSDWTAFFHFAGIPSLQWTMNGRGSYDVYHSVYDDVEYLTTWADSALAYTPAMAGVMGLAALRLASADALPFDYVRYADRIGELLEAAVAERQRGEISAPALAAPVRDALAGFRAAAIAVETRRQHALAAGDTEFLQRLNRDLPRVEAAFLQPPPARVGQPAGAALDRWADAWYRHLIYRADPATGYGSITMPSIQPHAGTGRGAPEPTLEELEAALRRAAALLNETATSLPP